MKEGDIDRYIKESSKSYRGCRVKNSARRNSLQKKTLGIETERKLAAAGMGREEKQLREQLKQMQIDKMKNSLVHNMREKNKKTHTEILESEEEELLHIPIEPYPVTLNDSPRSSPEFRRGKSSLDEMGKAFTQRRGRRLSREFEDLYLNTETGKLQKPPNLAKRLLAGSFKSGSRPTSSSLVKRNCNSSSSLRKSIDSSGEGSSSSAVSSLEDMHWIGAPEATKSVRRPRLTVEEQEFSSEVHKLSKTSKGQTSGKGKKKTPREKS